jgi:hypothetical protein
MTLKEEYEMNAREAQRMAENALSDPDRAAWLGIAQQWLRMLYRLCGNEAAQLLEKWPSTRPGDNGGVGH